MNTFLRSSVLVGCVSIFLGSGLGAAPAKPSKEFRIAKTAFQKAIRNKVPSERAAAFENLAEYPTAEAAGLVVKVGLTDSSLEVRRAANELLVSFRDHEAVGKYLLDQMKATLRKDGHEATAFELLKILGSYDFPELRQTVIKYLDDFLSNPKAKVHLLFTLIDEIGKQGAESSVPALIMLSEARHYESDFGYHRAIIQALTQIPEPAAVTFLISQISVTSGLIQRDIVQYLANITRQPFRADTVGWSKWWEQNKATFKFPKPAEIVEQDIDRDEGSAYSTSYYGIRIYAKRIAFVIDTSGSMNGEPLEAAKRELVKTIQQLPEDVYFSIVVFNSSVRVWHANMVPATADAKSSATRMINSQEAAGQTASYDALEMAFSLKPELIFFLSDGAPRGGKIVNPVEIVSTITNINHIRRVSIHAIGIGSGDPGLQILAAFMKALAVNNWGHYRAVDR